jgi:hypothetical protein
MPAQQWEHAVMSVDLVSVSPTWTYRARAWVGDREIYDKSLTNMYWSVPLADLGRLGWELVGSSPENAVTYHAVDGWIGSRDASMPVRMAFFFKRPLG